MLACRTRLLAGVLLLSPASRQLPAQVAQVSEDRDVVAALSSAQRALAIELVGAHRGNLVRLPKWYARLRGEVERRTGLAWRGPDPLVVMADQFPNQIACDGGRCDARLESVRAIADGDSLVASVLIVSPVSLMSEQVWVHELTHALLMQHGRVAESARHDPRWFSRAILAVR